MTGLSAADLLFAQAMRVARLATADVAGQPHVVPVCYACDGRSLYVALDDKPKDVDVLRLKRVRNIVDRPQVALVIDRYSDDWSQLAYLLIRGTAELIDPTHADHAPAVGLLRQRYRQYLSMPIDERPLIAIRPLSVVHWGNLA